MVKKIWGKISASFFITYIGMIVLHMVEDGIWILSGRFTDIPVWALFIGVIVIAFIATLWARKSNDNEK